jgi:hypothetical protein
MDEQRLARLVERVERSFPDDPVAQREAWELLESVLLAWDQAVAEEEGPIAAPGSRDTAVESARTWVDACRSLLRESGGRFVSAVQEILRPTPGLVTLGRATPTLAIEVEPETAESAGLQSTVTVEHGPDFLTLLVRIAEESNPSGLGAVVRLPDGHIVVQRFERIEATVASASFELDTPEVPVGVVLVFFEGPA